MGPRGHLSTPTDTRAFESGIMPMNSTSKSATCASRVGSATARGSKRTICHGKSNQVADVVVVGSGVGGLCAAAMLARYGLKVNVCESHEYPGGAMHAFRRKGYTFDVGPSLFSGTNAKGSASPLRQVLQFIKEEVPCIEYDTWQCFLPEGVFMAQVGADQFLDVIDGASKDPNKAKKEWRALQERMAPLAKASVAMPPAALRSDLGVVATASRFAGAAAGTLFNPDSLKLIRPFSELMDGVVSDEFVQNWMNMLCFLLSGLPANGTLGAEVAFMFAEWYKPGCQLEFPAGGSQAIADALVRGIEKRGGKLHLRTHVEEILVENNCATGVRLKDGSVIEARRAVISNTTLWDLPKLLPPAYQVQDIQEGAARTPPCRSFMHLHIGFDATGLDNDLIIHHVWVGDWSKGVDAEQNMVLVSIPSVLDPSLAPEGKHTLHAYTPGNEPQEMWEAVRGDKEAYEKLKEERSRVLWQAVEKVIPDIHDRIEISMVGTPLTHEKFLRRYRGTYGPAIIAGEMQFPGHTTSIKGLYRCGDSTFPGIGVPAAAASGQIVANSIVSVADHWGFINSVVQE